MAGIDDFDDAGVSLFSAFNMLVLGVFQLDTVRVPPAPTASLTHLTLADPAVHQVRSESGGFSVVIPVLDGLHSNHPPQSPHWYYIASFHNALAAPLVFMLLLQPS